MAQKYNPLLKFGFQETGGGGDVDEKIAALQNAVNALQENLNTLKNSKITKVTASSQLAELTDGEIFEWQTTTTQLFTQGYFYKKNGNNYTRVDLQPQYNLPIAAAETLGGVKVGSGLNIDDSGVLSVTGEDSLKVPRCFTQAQINALTDNDIFEWQGNTTADLVNGYFYKKYSPQPQTVHCCRLYENVPFINGSYGAGDYLFKEKKTYTQNIHLLNVTTSLSSSNHYFCITLGEGISEVGVGTIFCKESQTLETFHYTIVTSISEVGGEKMYECDDGTTFSIVSNSDRYGNDVYLYTLNNVTITMLQNEAWNPVVALGMYNNMPYPILFAPWQRSDYYIEGYIGLFTDVVITPLNFVSVDTQAIPQLQLFITWQSVGVTGLSVELCNYLFSSVIDHNLLDKPFVAYFRPGNKGFCVGLCYIQNQMWYGSLLISTLSLLSRVVWSGSETPTITSLL